MAATTLPSSPNASHTYICNQKILQNNNIGLMYTAVQNLKDPVNGQWLIYEKDTQSFSSAVGARSEWCAPPVPSPPPSQRASTPILLPPPDSPEFKSFGGVDGLEGLEGLADAAVGAENDAALQAALLASLQPSATPPEESWEPVAPEGHWLTQHAPTNQYKCFILKDPSSSADKIFGTTACCIIATITALRNCVEPNLPLRVVTANALTSPDFEGSSGDVGVGGGGGGGAGLAAAPEGGRLLWAELLQTGTEAYVAKLQQEGKVDAQTKPLFYVPEILELSFERAGIVDPVTISALKNTKTEYNVQLNSANKDFSVGDAPFIGRDGLRDCLVTALRLPDAPSHGDDAGNNTVLDVSSKAEGSTAKISSCWNSRVGSAAGSSSLPSSPLSLGISDSDNGDVTAAEGGGGGSGGGAAEEEAETRAEDGAVQPCRRSIIITHFNKTFALLQQGDGRIFFRDSHVDQQWDFVDEADFVSWLASPWCRKNYFIYESYSESSSQIDIFVLTAPLEGHPRSGTAGDGGGGSRGGGGGAKGAGGSRGGGGGRGGATVNSSSGSAVAAAAAAAAARATASSSETAAAAAIAFEAEDAQDVRDSVLEYSDALNERLDNVFAKLDLTEDMVLSREDFHSVQNGSWLWSKLLSVAALNVEDTFVITRWKLHAALIKRALMELGVDMYKLPQPAGNDTTVQSYLTARTVLKYGHEVLLF